MKLYIFFDLDENGMTILQKCLTEHGRYVNKGSNTIFFIENGEAQEVVMLIENETKSNVNFSFNPQIIKLMKDRECWFIVEKKLLKVKRAV
ncbi:hypothetical protein ES705_48474 [subsurface metagenome]